MNKPNSNSLKRKMVKILKLQGFKINPHVRPAGNSKRTYKRVQKLAIDGGRPRIAKPIASS